MGVEMGKLAQTFVAVPETQGQLKAFASGCSRRSGISAG